MSSDTDLNDSIEITSAVVEIVTNWYEGYRRKDGGVNTNVMTSALAVAELLRDEFPLTENHVRSKGGTQVRGLSGAFVEKVLKRHGEKRPFTSEGGRTSRGTVVLALDLKDRLNKGLNSFELRVDERAEVADAIQEYVVEMMRGDYYGKQRIEVDITPNVTVAANVARILTEARNRGDVSSGAVAQHLVGAKLELRFPNEIIGRDSATAGDLQTGRQGDFQIGQTAFHVTVSPMPKLDSRVRANITDGYAPVVLVPEEKVQFARGLFDSVDLSDLVGVQSIETFVGTNIDELGNYAYEGIKFGLAALVRRYNERIETCESDLSLRLKEPAWIAQCLSSRNTQVEEV